MGLTAHDKDLMPPINPPDHNSLGRTERENLINLTAEVLGFLSEQGEPSFSGNSCMYIDDDGRRCAIGALSDNMSEANTVCGPRNINEAVVIAEAWGVSLEHLPGLQRLHDDTVGLRDDHFRRVLLRCAVARLGLTASEYMLVRAAVAEHADDPDEFAPLHTELVA